MRDYNLEAVDGTILYIGAGMCPELTDVIGSPAQRIILVEPKADHVQYLRRRTANERRVEVLHAAAGTGRGQSSLRSFPIPEMDCLEGTTPDRTRFPGLVEISSETVPVADLGELVRSHCTPSGLNLLILDAPGLEAIAAPALATVRDLELLVLVRIPPIWQDAGLSLRWSKVIDHLKLVGYHIADFDPDAAWDSRIFLRQVETDISVMFREKQGKLIDKWTSYLDRYNEALIPRLHSVRRLLEIGVQNGGSMDVWRQAFVNLDVAVGVDIDEKCSGLVYEDHRVNIVVGAAEHVETVGRVLGISPEFDLIIDDGSHVSSHVIQNFMTYFPALVDGGLYIVEDVHTSYWEKFGGGLSNRDSQMAFFKSLTDVINHEHWSDLAEIAAVVPGETRCAIRPEYEVSEALSKISEIRFVNSMVFIYKGNNKSELGSRIVRGTEADVTDLAWHKRVGEGASVTDMKHKAVW